jgi:NitT/TauT family transport system ATP-binding protein/nitrate/nitrite transport system substrate-binding protein
MLPPLALAMRASLRGPGGKFIVPLSLSQGGNAIVVSRQAADALVAGDPRISLHEWLRAQPVPPRFAVVHAFSTHNLLLRYWLAAGGADPDRDIETVVIPPEDVVAALGAGRITGFCAGAPWGDVAVRESAGRIIIGTSSIWPFHPEKCLAVSEAWAEAHPQALRTLLRAVLRAQVRCDQAEHAPTIAGLLADSNGLNLSQAASRGALPGGDGLEQIRFHAREAWFPARAHAVWFLDQMRRWKWLDGGADLNAIAASVYRPDLLAAAVEAEGLYAASGLPSLEGSAMLPMPDEPAFGWARLGRRTG